MDKLVEARVENGVVVLSVTHGPGSMLQDEFGERLSKDLQGKYQEEVKKANVESKSCIVFMKAETAGSLTVRALFDLYTVVDAKGGELVCANYPPDYIYTLTAIGLIYLRGFSLARTMEQAFAILKS